MVLKEVTKSEFYAAIGKGNVHPRQDGSWPYTSVFVDQNTRREVGRIEPDGRQFRYLLREDA